MYRLWSTFKEERENYIDLSRTWVGQDYNLKFAHLILKAVTYKNESAMYTNAIAELGQMTKEAYNVTVRQKAIENLMQLNEVTDVALKSLIDLSLHQKWQPVKFAKETLRELLKSKDIRTRLENLKSVSSSTISNRIDYFLNEKL